MMNARIMEIDGAQGEGGGQVLRSSLALSVCSGTPLRMHGIRAGRRKPGLMRQHLTAVRLAAQICGATVEGDRLRSTTLEFVPGAPRAGDYHCAVGTAGSTMLVFQTVLWPLLVAEGRSRLVFEGGTHNPMAPPFDFIERSLLPVLRAMGAEIEVKLERAGFYPAGGGRLVVEVEGGPSLAPWRCLERSGDPEVRGRALLSNLPVDIGRRELQVVHQRLGWPRSRLGVERVSSDGPGNVVLLEVTHGAMTTVACSFGTKGVLAEDVSAHAVEQIERFLAANVPVGEHLADQLIIPLALAGGGSFRTVSPTLHTRTQAQIVQRWLPVTIEIIDEGNDAARVDVRPRSS